MLIAPLALTLLAAACGTSGSASSPGSANPAGSTDASGGASSSCTTRILLVSNFTGAGAQNGQASLAGTKVAVKQINAKGGVLGCQLQLQTADDQSNYSTDLPLLESATSTTHFALVMNSDYGAASTAPYVARQGLLEIAGAGAEKFALPSGYPTIFDTAYLSALPFGAAVKYAISTGHKRLAVIVDNTAIGTSDIAALKTLLAGTGAQVTDTEQIDLSGVDFTSAIQRAQASDPDAVIDDIFGAASSTLRKEIQEASWNVPIFSGETDSATNFKGLIPASDLAGDYVVGPASMALPSPPGQQQFISDLQAGGTAVTSGLWLYSASYDAVAIFAWAADQTKSTNPQTLATFLHSHGSTAVPGLIGATTTGYSANSGEWNPANGLAVMKAGYQNEGRLPSVKLVSAPQV